jgi:2'-5' RNA ligase
MRLFLATTFPEPVLRAVNDRVSAVKPRLPPASWVRPETQHLTFAFLGEQPDSLIDALAPLLDENLEPVGAFQATLRGSGVFPNPRHARVGWVGVDPEQRFTAVARAVRAAVGAAGVELDGGEFRPHLTLMRIRDRWPPLSIETFCKSLRDFCSEAFAVDHVTLYSSQLNPSGAVHTALREFRLSCRP